MLPLPLFADAGIPAFKPDWSNTSPLIFAAVGLCLSCFVAFGGVWAVRHPLAALGILLVIPGVILTVFSVLLAFERELLGLICLLPGLPLTGLGGWLVFQKKPFVGKSLVFLILAIVSAVGINAALNSVTWINLSEEYRKRSRETLKKPIQWDRVDQQAAPPAKPSESK
jgi:hypothetical protein